MKESDLLVVGLSHRTAPLEVRERLTIDEAGVHDELGRLRSSGPFAETVLITTCNRVELYATSPVLEEATLTAQRFWQERAAPHSLEGMLYHHHGGAAVRHVFRVASSLDSMVVGEPQILGQVKAAVITADGGGHLGGLLKRCFAQAFQVAKRVRNDTAIAEGSVSVSSIAIELAAKIFGTLDGRRVLLVGAGKMGEAAASKLSRLGARVMVINRSPERARALAEKSGGQPRNFDELESELVLSDIVVSSTSSQSYVLTPELVQRVVKSRRRKPLFLIDIAVPRDIDPRVGRLDNVFLYDVDDLQQVADENLTHRRRAAQVAETIVAEEVERFVQWRRSLEVTPTIVALRKRFREVAHAELARTLPRLQQLNKQEEAALATMCDAMVNKLLHLPVSHLKREAEQTGGVELVEALHQLFALEPEASVRWSTAPPAADADDASTSAPGKQKPDA